MKLTMFTGHPVTNNVADVEGDRISIRAEDGRTMFCIYLGRDGDHIEVSAVEPCMVDGRLHDTVLQIEPRVTNVVHIRTRLYGK